MLQRFVGGASMSALSLAYFNSQKNAEATGQKTAFLVSASSYRPMFEKRYKNGEDAHFIDKGGRMICVFDGVGSWTTKTVDVGAYTKEVVGHIDTVFNTWHLEDRRRSLHEVLHESVMRVRKRGSTTAVLAELAPVFDESGEEVTMRTCNLGDSGYMLFRPLGEHGVRLLFRSES